MKPTYFIWVWEEYDWNGRTEYRRKIVKKVLSLKEVREFLSNNMLSADDDQFHIESMDNIDQNEYED